MKLSPDGKHRRWLLSLAGIWVVAALFANAQDAGDIPELTGPPALEDALAAYQELDDSTNSPEAARLFQLLRIHAEQAVEQARYGQACEFYRRAFDVATDSLAPADMTIALHRLRQLGHLRLRQQRVEALLAAIDARNMPVTITDVERLLTETGDVNYVRAYLAQQGELDDVRLRALALTGPLTGLSPEDTWKTILWMDTLASRAVSESVAVSIRQELGAYCLAYLQGIDETHPNYLQTEAITLAAFEQSRQAPTVTMDLGGFLPEGVWLNLLDFTPTGLPNMTSWQAEGASLLSAARGNTASYLPIDFTDAEYELRLCFNRRSARGRLTVFFPVGNQLGRLLLSGTRAGDRLNNEGMQPSLLADESFHVISIKVYRDEMDTYQCELWTDGQLAVAGPLTRDELLSMSPAHREMATGRISFNAAGGEFELFAMDLLLSDGRALPLSDDVSLGTPDPNDRRKTIELQANRPWQWVMEVQPGQVLDISATGQWSPEADLLVGPGGDEFGWYGLRGRLMESNRTFTVGEHTVVIVTRPDILKLEMDDPDKSDNTGSLNVTVTTYSLQAPADSDTEGD